MTDQNRPDPITTVNCYAIGILNDVTIGPGIVEYLERIDATLAPFGGRFIIHGGVADILEGQTPGTLVVIEFAGRSHAEGWYASDAYQAILALRTDNSTSTILLIDGVDPQHLATDVLHHSPRPTLC